MSLKLSAPLIKDFKLPLTDKMFGGEGSDDEPTSVTIKQAAQGEHTIRMDLWSRFTRQFEGDQLQVVQDISPAHVQRKEVFLTMTACNIEGEDGEPLFKFPLVEKQFIKAWNLLPVQVANEIHSKVLEMNPIWSGDSGEEDI